MMAPRRSPALGHQRQGIAGASPRATIGARCGLRAHTTPAEACCARPMIDAADLRSLCLLSAVRPAGAAEPYSSPPLIGGGPRSSSGSLAKFTVIRRASSRVSRFGRRAVRRSDMSEIGGKRKCAACACNDVDNPKQDVVALSFTPSQAILPWQETQEREIG